MRIYTHKEPPTCPQNDWVVCYPWECQCETCGWNPKVAKERLEKICKERDCLVPEPQKEAQEEGM